MNYTKEELERILENDFLLNPMAFSPGRTNDDVVDSMCICFAIDREWTELFAKWVDNYETEHDGVEYISHFPRTHEVKPREWNSAMVPEKDREIERILEHYERVKQWLEGKEKHGNYIRGEHDIMGYSINY